MAPYVVNANGYSLATVLTLTAALHFPGCITAAQRNDNVFVSGISNGEWTIRVSLPELRS